MINWQHLFLPLFTVQQYLFCANSIVCYSFKTHPNKNKYIANLNEYRLLIIDDFGMERDTPFATEHIFNVIDSRYRANKPIILTTNLSATKLTAPSNLKEQRVYSRILEMAVPIVFSGENKRIVKMKEKVRKANTLLING